MTAAVANLKKISSQRLLGFSDNEIKAICEFFNERRHKPTVAELEMIAQAWSEHTRHKTLRGEFRVQGLGFRVRKFKNLLEETVFAATEKLDKPWVLSAFKDNAGIVALDKTHAVAIKVETHNHPSALMPYGGASTGLGGVIRDIMGAGLGAYPIAGIDVFCVSLNNSQMLDGLASGVRDCGNRMGIPTIAGDIVYDDVYKDFPLVFCGCVGLLPRSKVKKKGPNTRDLVYVVGSKTGRDGIHGATFSSQAHAQKTPTSVVQIGNPILEKKLLDFLAEAQNLNLYNSITDLGAGGIACALWEMASSGELGAKVNLDDAPVKEPSMAGWEILVSESQERMMLSVPSSKKKRLESLLERFELDFACLGKFVPTGRVEISYQSKCLVNLPIQFLKEVPKKKFVVCSAPSLARKKNAIPRALGDLHNFALELLSSPNIASKASIIRQYDHEVGGRTVIKPFVGMKSFSPSDASVLKPLLTSFKGIAVGLGWQGSPIEDPRGRTLSAFEEALRNVIAVGGQLEHISVLDNYCAGKTEDEKVLLELVLVSEALRDASLSFAVPFISGKDSLNNTTASGRNCPTIALVTALGVLKDIRRCVTTVIKGKNNFIYLVGLTREEWKDKDNFAPIVDLKTSPKILKRVSKAITRGYILSCHDLADGGLFIALAEMLMGSSLGIKVDLNRMAATTKNPLALLFAESNTRFLLEVKPRQAKKLERLFKDLPFARIGKTRPERELSVRVKNKTLGKWPIAKLIQAYQNPNYAKTKSSYS